MNFNKKQKKAADQVPYVVDWLIDRSFSQYHERISMMIWDLLDRVGDRSLSLHDRRHVSY